MTTSHTPGPWIALEQGKEIQSYDGLHEVAATAPNGTFVNICQMFQGGFANAAPNPADETRHTITPDEALANARLIAAAPDLLAALEDAAEFCRRRGGSWAEFEAVFRADKS